MRQLACTEENLPANAEVVDAPADRWLTLQPATRRRACQPGLEEGHVSASSEEEDVPFGVTLS